MLSTADKIYIDGQIKSIAPVIYKGTGDPVSDPVKIGDFWYNLTDGTVFLAIDLGGPTWLQII